MVQPFDYTTNTGNPLAALTQAYGQGMQIRSVQEAQALAQADAQRKAAEQQRAEQERMMLRQGMVEWANAKTPAEKIAIGQKNPILFAQIAETGSKYDKAINNALADTGLKGFALLNAGNTAGAATVFRDTATALRNSNQPALADDMDVLAKGAETSPAAANDMVQLWLAKNAPERFAQYGETLEKVGKGQEAVTKAGAAAEQRPLGLRALTADVATKEAKASVAAPLAALELEKAGWDIKALENDIGIKRQNAQIAAINAAINREGNDLKRQELQLKVAELNDKVGTRIQERAAEGKSAQAQADILLSTADRALRAAVGVNPKTNKLNIDPKTGQPREFTSIVRDATGTIQSRLPTLDQDVADFETIIDTLGSQATMARLGEMKGVLSDRDLEVLRSSMGSLSLRQSPSALVSNLMTIQRLTNKAKQVTAERYGVPANAAAGSGQRMRYNPATGRVE